MQLEIRKKSVELEMRKLEKDKIGLYITWYAGLQSYDKEVMAFLIEKAEVFSENTIQVTWKHQDIYDKVFSITR